MRQKTSTGGTGLTSSCQREGTNGSRALTYRSKRVKFRGIVHEDLLSNHGIGCPRRQQVQHEAVVDLEQRRQLGRLASGARIGMRPVRSPEDALGVRRD